MKRHLHPSVSALIVLAYASLACQALGGDGPASTREPQQPQPQETVPTETETPSQPAVEPATVSSQGAGIACVGSGTGISCLTDNGWQVYTDENSNLPNNYLYAGSVCPDGQIAIGHIDGVVLFDGATFTPIPEIGNFATIDGVACDAGGTIWAAHFQGVSRFANGEWTTFGSENLAGGESANELVYDIEVAPDGRVWVVTSRSVALYENDSWTIYQEGQGFDDSRFFNALALDANGRPWAAHSSGVDVFENGVWTSIEKTDFSSPESLAVDAQGQVWFGTIIDGAHLYNGSMWTVYNRASNTVSSDYVGSIAADSGGRVWFGTTYGLSVFDGTNWQTYLMSNSGLGDNDIEFVVVTKDGPALPALEEKPFGSLTGKLENADGSPLVDVTVEICVETLASTFIGDTPCSDQPFFLSTKTDSNGSFLIVNVPAGYYVIVAETSDGDWAQLTDEFGISSERTLIQAGEVYDIETLTVE
ncbi:MAG TPA: two-component regulator propeller domain-containing protein, partial [Anaerolineales bacterium]|nr:two-component regulator propeller domain-containing protein [Anaerolineales bacterium]